MDKIDLKNVQVNEQTDPKKLIEIINALRGQTVKTENKPTEIKDVNKPKRPYFTLIYYREFRFRRYRLFQMARNNLLKMLFLYIRHHYRQSI